MKIVRLVTYYFLGIFAIICISIVPQYLSTMRMADSPGFLKQLVLFFGELFNPDSWQYVIQSTSAKAPLMEILWPAFIYSMEILLACASLRFLCCNLLGHRSSLFAKTNT